jgi:hypothetical protein
MDPAVRGDGPIVATCADWSPAPRRSQRSRPQAGSREGRSTQGRQDCGDNAGGQQAAKAAGLSNNQCALLKVAKAPTSEQLAVVDALVEGRDIDPAPQGNSPSWQSRLPISEAKAAEMCGVNVESGQQARQVLESGNQDEIAALRRGEFVLTVHLRELGDKIKPLIEDLLAEGKKNMATMSPGTVMHRTILLKQLLIEHGVLQENDRFKNRKGKQGGALAKAQLILPF